MEIICPYCCHRFDASHMVFRMEKTQEEIYMQGMNDEEDEYVDEQLVKYYEQYEQLPHEQALMRARELSGGNRTIDIFPTEMGPEVTDYNVQLMRDYHFVPELTYQGRRLKKRLCPNCHHEVVKGSGLYEMKLIAMYGSTNSGKTVYLSALESVLAHDPRIADMPVSYDEDLSYQGNEEQQELHEEQYEKLIEDGELYSATTGGIRVEPQAFLYTYRTPDQRLTDRQKRKVLVVFCDIAGEDLNRESSLQKTGFYLRYADGLICLIDATKLPGVKTLLEERTELRETGRVASTVLSSSKAIDTLTSYMTGEFGDRGIPIPAAMVLTKIDELEGLPLPGEGSGEIVDHICNGYSPNDDPNDDHISFFNQRAARLMNANVQRLLLNLGGKKLGEKIASCFTNYSFFAVSALGQAPQIQGDKKILPEPLRPLRVTEPYYWLLAKKNCIPYHYLEQWLNEKEQKVYNLQFYYYERERFKDAPDKLKEERAKRFSGKGWKGPRSRDRI